MRPSRTSLPRPASRRRPSRACCTTTGTSRHTARERVEAALRDSGYRLNTVAQELRRQRTIALGLIMHGFANPVFADVAMGVEEIAAEQGFHVLLFNARGNADLELRHVETLLRRRVDGIIFSAALRLRERAHRDRRGRLGRADRRAASMLERPLCSSRAARARWRRWATCSRSGTVRSATSASLTASSASRRAPRLGATGSRSASTRTATRWRRRGSRSRRPISSPASSHARKAAGADCGRARSACAGCSSRRLS